MAAERKTRRFRVNQIRALQAEGKSLKEIAETTGLSLRTVWSYSWDPDGSRHRSYIAKLRRTCAVCGKPCSKRARICFSCLKEQNRATKVWTREKQIAKIQEFAKRWGRPPVWTDTMAYPRDLPNGKLIWQEFGSWANAVEAAGFPRPKRGGPKRRNAA